MSRKKYYFLLICNVISVLITWLSALAGVILIPAVIFAWVFVSPMGDMVFNPTSDLERVVVLPFFLMGLLFVAAMIALAVLAIFICGFFLYLSTLKVLGHGNYEGVWIVSVCALMLIHPSFFFAALILIIVYTIRYMKKFSVPELKYRQKWLLISLCIPFAGSVATLIKFRKEIKYLIIPQKEEGEIFR